MCYEFRSKFVKFDRKSRLKDKLNALSREIHNRNRNLNCFCSVSSCIWSYFVVEEAYKFVLKIRSVLARNSSSEYRRFQP
jgi:hypothetical protein